MNPVMLNLFGVEIKWYSVLILTGIIIGFFLVLREAKKFNISHDTVIDLCFWGIVFGIIGARIYYVLFNISYYQYNMVEIFEIWNGGLAIHGGLIAGVIAIYIYTKRKKLDFMRILDIAVPAVILAQAIGRWGNFFNSEAHGFATTIGYLQRMHIPEFIIKGMNIGGIYYLPTFYFEFLWCLLGFIVLYFVRKYKYIKIGQTTSLYLAWYSFGRFFIESWRTDSLMLGGFKVAQIVSILGFVFGLWYFIYLNRKGKYERLYHNINRE